MHKRQAPPQRSCVRAGLRTPISTPLELKGDANEMEFGHANDGGKFILGHGYAFDEVSELTIIFLVRTWFQRSLVGVFDYAPRRFLKSHN